MACWWHILIHTNTHTQKYMYIHTYIYKYTIIQGMYNQFLEVTASTEIPKVARYKQQVTQVSSNPGYNSVGAGGTQGRGLPAGSNQSGGECCTIL